MKELTDIEIKKIQLGILEYVTEFCERENISYFLGFGTLIGAVRHRGYIPWDDDIDLIMPRPDYERFINSYNFENEDYKIYSHTIEKSYPYPFVKVANKRTVIIEKMKPNLKQVGVNIDIFPIDGLPSSLIEKEKQYKKVFQMKRILSLWNYSSSKVKFSFKGIVKRIISCFDFYIIVNRIDNKARLYNYNKANDVGMIVWSGSTKVPSISKKVFEDYKLEFFEGKEYRIPIGYHEWLTKIYGDYMKLPPIEQRVSHHDFKAYFIEH